jgi:hypothetical protein
MNQYILYSHKFSKKKTAGVLIDHDRYRYDDSFSMGFTVTQKFKAFDRSLFKNIRNIIIIQLMIKYQ